MGHIVSVLPAFLLACVAVAALPGPSTALFLHRTVRDGRKAGLAAVAGNEIGVFCWALAAGAGLTALLRANAVLFAAMHIIGAAAALAAIQVLVIDGPYCAMIVLLASRARHWLSRAVIRRRMERALGATLICLGIDLAAAAR